MGFLKTVKMPWSPRTKSPDAAANDDNDAEAQIARNLWRNYYLLTPASPRRSKWDWLLVVLVTFTSLQIPFVLLRSTEGCLPEGCGGYHRAL